MHDVIFNVRVGDVDGIDKEERNKINRQNGGKFGNFEVGLDGITDKGTADFDLVLVPNLIIRLIG